MEYLHDKPIEQLNFLAQAAADRANEGDMRNALTLIRKIAEKTDALLHSNLTAQTAAIAELQGHHEALIRFYDN